MPSPKCVGKGTKKKRVSPFLKCFLIVIILLLVGVVGFLYFNLFLPEGSGPAGSHVPIEPFQQVWSERDVLLLGIGDSITVGVGSPKGFSYFERLAENPPQDCQDMIGKNLSAVFPKLKTKNTSVSGSVSSHHASVIKELEIQPSHVMGIVVMTSGGNDLIHSYGAVPPREGAMYGATLEQAKPWIDNFQERLDQMIIDIKGKFPGGCHIFVANIYDPSDGTGNTTVWLAGLPKWPDGMPILKAYNEIISQCVRKHANVHLVDIHNAFLGHGIHCKKFWHKHYRSSDPTFWYCMVEEPSVRGQDAIRRLFLIEMAKTFFYEKSANSSSG